MKSERELAQGAPAEPTIDGATPRLASDGAPGANLGRRQWRQLIIISIAAVAIYVTMRLLPTGTNLNHMDFRVQGGNSIEFCDASNPQFIPVVAVRSPVTLTVSTGAAPVAQHAVHGTLTLRTFSGKPIAPEDLLVVHEHPLHLMIVDPSLTDYQHVHPQPSSTKGEWTFSFTPRFGGTYRLFADFTPVATARGLYATADLTITGNSPAIAAASAVGRQLAVVPEYPAGTARAFAPVDQDGYHFELTPAKQPVRAAQPIDLTFTIAAPGGANVPMQPIMGAYAHLVAFNSDRTGFAHLHPVQADPLQPPDVKRPRLAFKLTIPSAGRYVIWAQVNLGGREVFAPFWFAVSGDSGS